MSFRLACRSISDGVSTFVCENILAISRICSQKYFCVDGGFIVVLTKWQLYRVRECVWSPPPGFLNGNARYGFLFALSKMGMGSSGLWLPYTTPWVQHSVRINLARSLNPSFRHSRSGVWQPQPGWSHAYFAEREQEPIPGISIQESLVWDHIPRCQVWDSKRVWHGGVSNVYCMVVPRQLPAKPFRYIDTLTLAIACQDPLWNGSFPKNLLHGHTQAVARFLLHDHTTIESSGFSFFAHKI